MVITTSASLSADSLLLLPVVSDATSAVLKQRSSPTSLNSFTSLAQRPYNYNQHHNCKDVHVHEKHRSLRRHLWAHCPRAAQAQRGALSAKAEAEEAKLQGAVAVNSLEDQISNFYFAEEEDAKIKENIARSRYGRMSGKSGKSIPSCTKRLLNDCYHVGRQVRRGYSLPSSVSVRSRGDSGFFREICRDVCDVRIPSEKYRGSSSKSNTSSDIIVRKSDKSDSDFSNVEGASEMEPSKAWDDDYDEDMMDIDTFGGSKDGDGDLLSSIITVKGDGRHDQFKSSKAGERINSLALQRACHSAFEFNRIVRRSFARRCANNFGYILESFPTVRRFEEGEEPEEEN